ncbi:MAG: endonuclease III, partial [Candidatus Limnocylindria bacterium]|nr:endonuclease III [Candidatus Limnocylindria bacterium]
DIHETGFFRQKAKAIRSCVGLLLADYAGEVPRDMDSLVRLPGVGRKTASIVLGNAFKVPAVAVDRHVDRVADRLRFSLTKGTDATEMDLRTIFPPKDWVKVTWCLVLHGRRVCRPTPKCYECPVSDLCPYPKKTKDPAARAIRRSIPQEASTRRSR